MANRVLARRQRTVVYSYEYPLGKTLAPNEGQVTGDALVRNHWGIFVSGAWLALGIGHFPPAALGLPEFRQRRGAKEGL
jgi:hypothetical protein